PLIYRLVKDIEVICYTIIEFLFANKVKTIMMKIVSTDTRRMKMKRARIIYNPTSGREVFKKELVLVLKRFEEAGYETSTHATTHEGDAANAAKYAVDRKFDLVIAAGGDGTINEVLHGMAEQDYRPQLAIIPVGTT